MKNGTPYRKMLFPEQSMRLESVFPWSLRRWWAYRELYVDGQVTFLFISTTDLQ